MAMGVALIHVAVGLLVGHSDWTTRLVEAAVIGAVGGGCYGVYIAFRQPRALPTPAAFRPRFLVRLLRGAGHASWPAASCSSWRLFLVCFAISWSRPWTTLDAAPAAAAAPADLPAGAAGEAAPAGAHEAVAAEAHGAVAADAAFALETPPALMASLAKVYGDPRFPDMFTARAAFRAGDRPVADYRVRFRLTDYVADWGPWSEPAAVAAHHAATAAYYPILDQDRLARLDGPAAVDVEAEYEYRADDGRSVHKVEGRRLQVYARNMFLIARVAGSDAEMKAQYADPNSPLWRKINGNVRMELPALVTKDDPVILQVAGWVSGQAGGGRC